MGTHRKRTPTCLALLTAALLAPASARAEMVVELEWVDTTGAGTTGSNFILVEPGDRITLDIFVTVDEAGVDTYQLSVIFDEDLRDELDLVGTEEYDHVPDIFCEPFPECFNDFGPELTNFNEGIELETESDATDAGSAEGFEASAMEAVEGGPSDITIRVGRIVFDVTENVDADGIDIEASLLFQGDGYLDNDLKAILPGDLPDPRFVPGFAPEPRSGVLAATALVCVAALARRRHSSRVYRARGRST